jgi:two-component system, chemotaxis family, sensor kinase CheA
MSINLEQFHQTFFDESFEGLQLMESGLLHLNQSNGDMEQINVVFRAAHSIKGGSGTFGFTEVSAFTHQLESLLDEMRSGLRAVTNEALELLLQAVDCLREMLNAAQAGTVFNQERAQFLHREFEQLMRAKNSEQASQSQAAQKQESSAGWQILFQPMPHLFSTGNEPILLFQALAELGDLTVETDISRLPGFTDMDPESCYFSWKLTLRGNVLRECVNEIFEWLEGDCKLEINPLQDNLPMAGAATAISDENKMSISPAESQAPAKASAESLAPERRSGADRRSSPDNLRETASIRVSIEKIDALINTVGELVITQAMLSQLGENFDIKKLDNLRDGLDQLERNTHELQESVMGIRMLPMSFAFNRFPRLVHDLSQKLGKKAELKVEGAQTELDKTVLEKIGDPLVHLVRNSLDHGIETPEVRVAAGKNETGIIRLSAYHKGGSVNIEISDDGAGINKERLVKKAQEKGLIGSDETLSDENIFELIFLPGMSTAEVVNDISGRGVGMDVVRRNIRELQGQIEVHSREGQGTTILIRLPLTLAILDGQLVRIGKENCIIPLVSICESLQMESGHVSRVAGCAEIYTLRGNHIPIVRPADVFGLGSAAGSCSGSLLVVVEGDGRRVGIVVDELLGQQQVVIKSLETNFRRVEGVSGATILGDGTVALIIDIGSLIDLARRDASQPAELHLIGGNV